MKDFRRLVMRMQEGQKKPHSFTVPVTTLALLKQESRATGDSQSRIVRKALEAYFRQKYLFTNQ